MMDLLSTHSWPHPTLARIHAPGQKPTRQEVLQTLLQVNSNAASITATTLGHPNVGLIGLVCSAVEYQQLARLPWIPPAQPPVAPQIPQAASEFVIQETYH